MLSLEEYIARRKKEDGLNEYDVDQRIENMRVCVNYVFEYFNNYLNITEAEERTALKDEKLDKYRKQLHDYEPEIVDWLVRIYSEHGKHLNRIIANISKQEEFFLLFDTDSEFRSLSYECYSRLIKKHPYLKDESENLFLFLKDYHAMESRPCWRTEIPHITDEMTEWIEKTWSKHKVNVAAFASRWIDWFWNDDSMWPATHKKKSQDSWRNYVYDHKQKSNLFNIDALYRRIPKKSFIKGRKQEFEVIMMYIWLHSMEGDEDGYWEQYLDKVLPFLKK